MKFRCFVARRVLSWIYALFGVLFPGLNMRWRTKNDKYQVCPGLKESNRCADVVHVTRRPLLRDRDLSDCKFSFLSCCSLHHCENKVCNRVWWSIVVQPSPNLICNLPKPSKQSHQSVKTCWWPKESFYAWCARLLLLPLCAVLSFCTNMQSAIDW